MPVDPQIQLTFQVCPIILSAGIAEQAPGGMLPIQHLFASVFSDRNQYGNLTLPRISNNSRLDDAFAAFNVLPGGTLVSQSIAKYPFANQYVAANAVIREPITVSVFMDAPMRGPGAWHTKLVTMMALKNTLDKHNNSGGTYIIVTPAMVYDNMIMTAMTDNSRGNNTLPQNAWRLDFERPLVAGGELAAVQSAFLNKITNGVPYDSTVSGPQTGLSTAQSYLNPGTMLPAQGSSDPSISSSLMPVAGGPFAAQSSATSINYQGVAVVGIPVSGIS